VAPLLTPWPLMALDSPGCSLLAKVSKVAANLISVLQKYLMTELVLIFLERKRYFHEHIIKIHVSLQYRNFECKFFPVSLCA